MISWGRILLPSSQTNSSLLHLVFYTKQELRVSFPRTKSERKSEVSYFLKWQSSSTTLFLRNSCYCPPLWSYWLLKKRYSPSPDSHLLLFFFFSQELASLLCIKCQWLKLSVCESLYSLPKSTVLYWKGYLKCLSTENWRRHWPFRHTVNKKFPLRNKAWFGPNKKAR